MTNGPIIIKKKRKKKRGRRSISRHVQVVTPEAKANVYSGITQYIGGCSEVEARSTWCIREERISATSTYLRCGLLMAYVGPTPA